MRIAIDVSSLARPGGSGISVYIRALIKNLAAVDNRDEFVLCWRLSRLKYRRYIGGPPGPNFSIRSFQEPFSALFGRSLDIFHGPDARVPRFRKPAIVATVHDLFSIVSSAFADRRFRKKKMKRYLDIAWRADLIIAVSEHTRTDVITHLGIEPERVVTVYHGVGSEFKPQSTEIVRAVRMKYGIPEKYILSVGNISRRKNMAGLIEAFLIARARRSIDRNACLVLAGTDGYKAREVYDAARGAPEGTVKFLGHADAVDLPALYSGAMIFALVSFYEGFGLPVLESMACGTPVICSDRASLPEIVGNAALIVKPNDIEGITAMLGRVCGSEATREDLIEKGTRCARAFTWEKTARETLTAYRMVCENA